VVIGVLQLQLSIPESNSLKDKRSVLKGALERTRNRFNVSVAETGLNDRWRSAEVAIVAVGNSTEHVHSVCSKVLEFYQSQPWFVVTDCSTQIL